MVTPSLCEAACTIGAALITDSLQRRLMGSTRTAFSTSSAGPYPSVTACLQRRGGRPRLRPTTVSGSDTAVPKSRPAIAPSATSYRGLPPAADASATRDVPDPVAVRVFVTLLAFVAMRPPVPARAFTAGTEAATEVPTTGSSKRAHRQLKKACASSVRSSRDVLLSAFSA